MNTATLLSELPALPALLWGKATQGGYQVLAQHPEFPAAAVAAVEQVREQFKQFPSSNGLSPHPPYVMLWPLASGQGWVLVRIRDQGKDEFQRDLTLRLEAGWCALANAEQLRHWLQDFPYWQVQGEADKPLLQLTTINDRLQELKHALSTANLQQPLLIGSLAPAFPDNFAQCYIFSTLQTPVTVQTVNLAAKTEAAPVRIVPPIPAQPTPAQPPTPVKRGALVAVAVLMLCLGAVFSWLIFSPSKPDVKPEPPSVLTQEIRTHNVSLTELKLLNINRDDYNTQAIPNHHLAALQRWRANTWQLYRYLTLGAGHDYLSKQLHKEATESIYSELSPDSANWPWLTEAETHERVLHRLQTVLATVAERNIGLTQYASNVCASTQPALLYQSCVYAQALTEQTVLVFLLEEWRESVETLRDMLI